MSGPRMTQPPSITIHHHPSPSITIHHHPSPSITIHHHPSPSITIHHHPSPSITKHSKNEAWHNRSAEEVLAHFGSTTNGLP